MSQALQTSSRLFDCHARALVMAIINVTPDSFSDGGAFLTVDDALRQAEKAIDEGADILDIGGESTRPGSSRVPAEVEIARVVPVIKAIRNRFDTPISIDTSKSEVAARACDAGAEIINDISGLRFDPQLAAVAAETGAALILMHSRGDFESMHTQPPVPDITSEVNSGLVNSINIAIANGVQESRLAIDPGIGFGKTPEQNLELLANLDKIKQSFPEHPILVGASRKSFIGKFAGETDAGTRLGGSIAAAALAVWNGANIIRAHDVAETVQAVRIVEAVRSRRN